MRNGPLPLSVHIGMAAASLGYQQNDIESAQRNETAMQNMLLGIRAYQLHPFKAERTALQQIWREGAASVSVAPGTDLKDGKPVLCLIPSMINKANILDLMPGRSLLHWLNAQGIHACLFDWGDGVNDAGQQDVESAVLQRLVPALQFLAQESGQKIHALGYCMGGTLLAGAALHTPESLRTLTFLAAPWDFHAGKQTLLSRVKFWAPSAQPVLQVKDKLSMEWVQTVFASVDPSQSLNKFGKFAAMDQESEEARIFVAVEDWLNDGVDLPAGIAQQIIQDWFLENKIMEGPWHLGGVPVVPEEINIPSLVIASDKDRLVEFDTAKALLDALPEARLHNPSCGHIGMMAGAKSVEAVWKPLAAWVQQNK